MQLRKGMVFIMNERQQIIYMQTRIMRLASEEWNKPVDIIAGLFKKYKVFQYIEEGFGIFHVEGDEAVMEDVVTYLKNKGVTSDGFNK